MAADSSKPIFPSLPDEPYHPKSDHLVNRNQFFTQLKEPMVKRARCCLICNLVTRLVVLRARSVVGSDPFRPSANSVE
jgi:hypothetical protein